MTAARIVEQVSGSRFSTFVQEEIIGRLPFPSATYNVTQAKLSGHLAEGFVQIRRNVSSGGQGFSKSVYEPTEFFIDEETEDIISGPGGLSMSAKDAVSRSEPFLLVFGSVRVVIGDLASDFAARWSEPRNRGVCNPA